MRKAPWLTIVLAVLILGAIGGGVYWYAVTPHSPEAQFAAAEKLEKILQGDAPTKSATELAPQIAATIEQYRRVGVRFGYGAANPKAAEALLRIANIQEKLAKSPKDAVATYDELQKYYTDEPNTGTALFEQARLIKAQAADLKSAHSPDTRAKYEEAIAKLERYRELFGPGKPAPASAPSTAAASAPGAPATASAPAPTAARPEAKRSQEALMEIGRIWQDGIGEPLIKPIDIFEKFLHDYPASIFEDEAMFRLAKAYENASSFEKAIALYTKLLDLYPKTKFAADALNAKGKLLADKMDKHDEAAREFQKMAEQFPDDPRGPAEQARSEEAQAAKQEGEKYAGSRYGGSPPVDTTGDKALPPADQLKLFAEQKLDAQSYDLVVDFAPTEHKMSVKGTLKLVNRGEDKKNLLFMLGPAFKVATLTMDGVAVTTKHTGETLQVILPAELKKDAAATMAFEYAGQYADPADTATPPPAKPASSGPATAPATLAGTTPLRSDMQIGLGPYGYGLSGAAWYPITIIGDVFDAHVIYHVPPGMEAVGNGAVVKRDKAIKEGDTGTFEFQTKNPVFGLYFAYGPYVVQEKQVGEIHYYTYLREKNKDKHEAYVAVCDRILSFYGSKLDGFPYEKMAIVDTPLPPMLGGVGPASLMFLQQAMVDHPEVPENLLAHELAHQWFGNLIPINITDPHYNQWLSEGFATYCDALYTEFKDGPKAFKDHIERYDQLYFTFAINAPKGSGAIKDTFSPLSVLYRPVIYEKGALVLHMLRKVVGDEKFFALLRKYVETYKNKPSTVDDFRKLASEVCGEDLSWFFAEWIDESVFVHWKVTATVAPDGTGFKTTALITAPDSLVKMPADVTFIGENESQKLVKKNVMLDKKENPVEASTPFKVIKVVVDEDNWVLKRPGTDNIWKAP